MSPQPHPIHQSLREYGRGIAGGLLFSLPLLYTMEVWWAGFLVSSVHLLGYMGITFVLLLGYNRYAGLRHDASWTEIAIDSVEELGLGIVCAASTLWLLGRLTPEMTLIEVVGKVLVEAMTVAIGVSVGTAQLGGDPENNGAAVTRMRVGKGGPGSDPGDDGFAGELVLATCGAVLFAANVLPTEEILVIAIETPSLHLALLMLASLALGAMVLYYSSFANARRHDVAHADALRGTVITYAVALVVSAASLAFFDRFDGHAPVTCVSQTVVLGFVAMLGASAGRLLLQ